MSIRTYLTAVVAMLSVANAHMIMSTPTPYGKSTLNNSPLVADGSDFPCKLRSNTYAAEGADNQMKIGDPQTLSFLGSAVHGGGSCQISLTTDAAPDKNTQWMVIHSIIGGCPADASGNLPEDPNGTGASNFTFSIPSGIAAGKYTLAWTWFNKIGNREMYMNCAPVTVTGGSAKKRNPAPGPKTPGFTKRVSSFPAMFVANIQGVSNNCATLESADVIFPNPGDSIQSVGQGPFTAPANCQGVAAVATSAASGGSGSSAATSTAPAATSAASEGSSGSGTVAPGVFASGAASGTGVAATSTAAASPVIASSAAASVASSAPSAAAPVASAAPSSSTTSGTSGAQSGACTDEGAWNCINGSSFQRCASGAWSAQMAMAAGTTCTPGVSSTLTMGKRALRFSQSHVRRSHRAWGH